MPITTILINVADVRRSVEFYTTFLHAEVIGEITEDDAVLDLVTATIRLSRLAEPAATTWIADDLQRGFRHVGFKVAAVDPMVEALDAAGVEFHLRPIDAEGGVRITFFFDPDGTLLELVEGDLHYHEVADADGVVRERALGVPSRPRFDHVAVTVDSVRSTRDQYRPFGFVLLGSIHQAEDARGFEIDYLKGGDTVLEVFSFTAQTTYRSPQLNALGFGGATLSLVGAALETDDEAAALRPEIVGEAVGVGSDSRPAYADADGLVFQVGR